MLTAMPGSWAIALLVALIPGAIRLWRDRALAGKLDDPLLPERLLARRRHHLTPFIFAGIGFGLLAGGWGLWLVPVAVLADLAAGYPLRKKLYDETWGLASYLWFFGRLTASLVGFWFVIGGLPWSAAAFGTPYAVVPIAAGGVLLVWERWSGPLLRALFRTRPIQDPALRQSFADLVARMGIPAPRFEYVDLRGGAVANAVAVPSLAGSAVVFTAPLLARLQTDEIVAICAHELAHLEYYDRRRLRQIAAAETALIAAGVALALIVPDGIPAPDGLLWGAAMLGVLVWRARDRQRNETICDRRAVELTGAPDALARGLAKVYAFARLPRRFDAAYEQRATHPSLARRIRDIQSVSGAPAATLTAPETFVEVSTGTHVTVAPSQLEWIQPGSGEHRLNYGALRELRLMAGRGDARLVAIDRTGHRWEAAIAAGDVARLQRALDHVDVQVAGPAAAPRLNRSIAAIVAMLAVAAAAAVGQFAAALVALLAIRAPTTRMMASAGVAALAGAALVVRDGAAGFAPLLAAAGISLCGIAWLRRGDAPDPSVRLAAGGLAIATTLAVLLLFSFGTASFHLHQAARAFPGAAVLLCAWAVLLRIGAERRASRGAALSAGIAAVAVVVLGSDAFLQGAVRDPLLVQAPRIPLTTIAGTPRATVPVSFDVGEVTLSPRGGALVIWRDNDDADTDAAWTAEAGPVGGTMTRVAFDDAVFTAENRLLAVRFTGGGADISEGPITDAPSWQVHVENISTGHLAYAADTRSWRLTGFDRRRAPVRFSGVIGAAAVQETRWNPSTGTTPWAIETDGPAALLFDKQYAQQWLPLAARRWGMFTRVHGTSARLTRTRPGMHDTEETSLLDVMCEPRVMSAHLVCAAFDDARTRLAAVSVASTDVLPLGFVDGRFATVSSHQQAGWLTGWLDWSPAAIDVNALTGVLAPPSADSFPFGMAAADHALAVIRSGESGVRVDIYAR